MEVTKHPVIRKGKTPKAGAPEDIPLLVKPKRVRAARIFSTPTASASGEPEEEGQQTVAGQESESEELLPLSQPPKRDGQVVYDQQKRQKGAAKAGAHDRIV